MKTSESIVKISEAFLKAQRNIGAATKGSANPFFRSKYADLGSVMEACKEALNNEGIAIMQPIDTIDGKHLVTTRLQHESGEFFEASMLLEVPKLTMQDLGSASSYARRYGLQSIGFIPAEDDDGEKTMKRGANLASVPTKANSVVETANVTEETKEVIKPSFNQNKKAETVVAQTATAHEGDW